MGGVDGECRGELRDLHRPSPDSSLPFGMTWHWVGGARGGGEVSGEVGGECFGGMDSCLRRNDGIGGWG